MTPEMAWKPDDALWAEYLPGLKRINPAFDESWILKKQVGRAEYAQPIVVPGLLEAASAARDAGPGLVVRVHGADLSRRTAARTTP